MVNSTELDIVCFFQTTKNETRLLFGAKIFLSISVSVLFVWMCSIIMYIICLSFLNNETLQIIIFLKIYFLD